MAEEQAVVTDAAVAVPTTPDWRESLTGDYEPLKAEKSLERYRDVPSLAKAYVELEKKIGARPTGVTVPGPDAKPEEIAAYHKALGVPETPDKYPVEWPKMPEGMAWDQKWQGTVLQRLHAKGAPPEVVQEVATLAAEYEIAQRDAAIEAINRERKAAAQTIATEWGPVGSPTYKHEMGVTRKTADILSEKIGDPAIATWIEDSGNDPRLLRLLNYVGHHGMEDEVTPDGDSTGRSTADIEAEIKKMREDRNGPLWNPMHPDAATAPDKLLELYKALGRSAA